MPSYNVEGDLLELIANYLPSRQQRVVLNGQTSSWKNICAGVPQGSILGHLLFTSSLSEVFLKNGVLKICSKFTVEHLCRSVISIKLQSNFIEITYQHGCSSAKLLHIFRTPFYKNTSEELVPSFLNIYI